MEAFRHPHSSYSGGNSFNHSVSRSNELLSCAKTSRKLLIQRQNQQQQQQQKERNPGSHVPPPPPPVNKPNLQLASITGPPPISLEILEDGLTLLRAMEYGTKKLQILVRRRGHTNDPTQEISTLVNQLEQDMKELTSFCEQVIKIRRRKQEQRHWELVVQWFQRVATHHSKSLQDCLKLRGEILAEQAQKRRKLVESSSGGNNSNSKSKNNNTNNKGGKNGVTASAAASASAAATPLFDSPLFTATPPKRNTITTNGNGNRNGTYANNRQRRPPQQQQYGKSQPSSNGSSSTYYRGNTPATYGAASSGYGGYGGGVSTSVGGYGHSGGMRQRKGGENNNVSSINIPVQEQEEEEKVHSQIQMRERKRQTQQRLNEARQAESTLSEVTTLFGKMSTLIIQQGETLEKIEDDVECALVDVSAGQEELTKLYSIKKGNRPLIVKTFFILNFLIIFMRAYYKK
ncbi:MAG: hypothetical protein ACI8RD_001322 [Bacillariaceae sp.]|jgi:hypothetical protein